jgi:hypothetical protein
MKIVVVNVFEQYANYFACTFYLIFTTLGSLRYPFLHREKYELEKLNKLTKIMHLEGNRAPSLFPAV